jgi:hypothetical protein
MHTSLNRRTHFLDIVTKEQHVLRIPLQRFGYLLVAADFVLEAGISRVEPIFNNVPLVQDRLGIIRNRSVFDVLKE